MYYEDKNRIPGDYYYLLKKSFPNICAVQSFGPEEFGACFQVFIEVQLSKYSERYGSYSHYNDGGRELGEFTIDK